FGADGCPVPPARSRPRSPGAWSNGRGGRNAMERDGRRTFLIASLSAGVAWTLARGSSARASTSCGATPSQTEGPYFKPNSPLRASLLAPGLPGTKLVVEGSVLTADCKPVPRALLDFWQADAEGHYDNSGQRLRGHQLTDDAGRYRLETVVPAQ